MKFEEALKQLDGIVEKLETGKLSVDESISLYSKAMELCKDCSDKLSEVKGQIALLEEKSNEMIAKLVEVD
ncbi:MAG: exodeoxyribonuclease VII small subunit [Clostridia bacterium]|nr:exodeoxyribonuclease VII small subunit [Clostridia bacterium]MDE7328681.1 exodeoxyribonuclease VII small subunit [Clostridia bacterium]